MKGMMRKKKHKTHKNKNTKKYMKKKLIQMQYYSY